MRKSDIDLMKQIKDMEAAKKKEKNIQEAIDNTLVDFEVWWKDISDKKQLKHHLKEIIWAEFKSRGLKRYSTVEAFNNAMRLFGYEV